MIGEVEISHRFKSTQFAFKARFQPGVTAIFGPSGAGKSSLLRMIAGLLHPSEGRIVVDGEVWFDASQGVRLTPQQRRVGFVFQKPLLFPHMNVGNNLRYGMRRARRRLDLGEMAALLGLSDKLDRRPSNLSGGEAQRVALGRALLSDPDILLLDEPLSALDTRLKETILPYFERLRDEREIPILYVTHDIDEVARLADTLILLEGGEIIRTGPVNELLATSDDGESGLRKIAGGLIRATVTHYDSDDDLTGIRLGDQELWLPGEIAPSGETVRLRIDARDVTLALERPTQISALNVLPVRVVGVQLSGAPGALIELDCQGQRFTARVTQRSVRLLGLAPGRGIFAILKAMSVLKPRIGLAAHERGATRL